MEKNPKHIKQHPTKVQVQDRSSQAPKMSSLRICCVIEDDDIAFPVDVRTDAEVFNLHKRAQWAKFGYPPGTLQAGVMEGMVIKNQCI